MRFRLFQWCTQIGVTGIPPAGASCEHDLASARAMLASGLDAASTIHGRPSSSQWRPTRAVTTAHAFCSPLRFVERTTQSRITSGERGRRVTVTRPTLRRHWFYPQSVNSTHRWLRSMRAEYPLRPVGTRRSVLAVARRARIQRRDGLLPEKHRRPWSVHFCDRQFGLAGRGRWKICAALLRCTQSLRHAFVGRQTGDRALPCPAKQIPRVPRGLRSNGRAASHQRAAAAVSNCRESGW